MIEAIENVADSIILVFSQINLKVVNSEYRNKPYLAKNYKMNVFSSGLK